MDDSGVTLLGYTQIPTDASYTPPQHFDPTPQTQCMDTSVSPARTSAASLPIPMSMASIIGAGSPTSAFGSHMHIGGEPPPYGAYSAVEPVVSSHYESANPYGNNYNSNYSPGQAQPPPSCMTLGPYTPSQASSPAMSITGAEFGDLDLDSLLSHSANPGPPCSQAVHIMEPMLPEEPPSKIKKEGTGFSSFSPKSRYGSGAQTMPHGAVCDLKQSSKRGGRSKYSTRSFPRASSPMFPDQSTPLSSISSLSRQPSISSLSTSSTSAPAKSVRSDPGVYRYEIHTDSAIHSPATSLLDSPKFTFGGPGGIDSPMTQDDSASRSCLEVEMPAKYSREIFKLDKKILELQAKRSKLLEKAKSSGTGPMPYIGKEDIMDMHWNGMDKPSDIGKVLLYIFPLGIREFDEPVYEEANAILRQVGGLYFDLQRALTNLREICCKGSILVPEISTCFAYIRSLLSINQRLKLTELTNGIYRIQLDLESEMSDGSSVPHAQEFNFALNAANEVLMSAQHITQLYPTMQLNLQKVKQRASDKVANFEQICGKLGIVAGERKNHIKSVLEGYSSAVESAGRVWQQYYQVAMDTISTITECIHPSAS